MAIFGGSGPFQLYGSKSVTVKDDTGGGGNDSGVGLDPGSDPSGSIGSSGGGGPGASPGGGDAGEDRRPGGGPGGNTGGSLKPEPMPWADVPTGDVGPLGPGWIWAAREHWYNPGDPDIAVVIHGDDLPHDYAWGAAGQFVFKTLTGDVEASNEFFSDPAFGTEKNLWIRPHPLTTQLPPKGVVPVTSKNGGGIGTLVAGASAGFFIGGPVGALIGAGIGLFLGKK
jgi:hypothetical protein